MLNFFSRRTSLANVARQAACVASVVASVALGAAMPAHAGEVVTDMAGRQVTLPDHVDRILLGEGRLLYAVALLEGKQPLKRIVGWQGELQSLDPQTWQQYEKVFPQIDTIPKIGQSSEATVSAEKALALKPDLAIFSIGGHGPGRHNALVKEFAAAGVPVIFVDFRQKPLEDTVPSLRLMGRAMHREAQAEAYISLYESHLKAVRDAVATIPSNQRPKVFVQMLAGVWPGCCHTVGNGNIGEFVDAAGGVNIARDLLPGVIGDLNIEHVIASQPDVYIATGTRGNAHQLRIHVGAETSASDARASLDAFVKSPGIASIKAVREGRTHGLWHNFYDSPYNIVAVEAMLGWFYPGRFKQIDANATFTEIHQRFLAVPYGGTYWTDGDKP
ncbi:MULTISPECIES: ABC transporter substrate-binding protein [Pandoraea]|uniref:ABC transporter substrate-binding protein n=1 Tax=Pandoraea TaxID=93217 RepID=UPI001F5CDD40|nr:MULTISPECIES: ABC transporter substrate-binding protein [Pandoraea]MCI3207827.1 iron ABC transporter substrate-binding protein [Pandoraea sp. LA3]MDN4585856.1 iron ABC transporter substrate-binding protein [Pandoraea capi]